MRCCARCFIVKLDSISESSSASVSSVSTFGGPVADVEAYVRLDKC